MEGHFSGDLSMEHLCLVDDPPGTPRSSSPWTGPRPAPWTPEGAASFDNLPLELRLKCLAYCDWQTLSRAACTSRSTRALVSVSSPQRQQGGARVQRPLSAAFRYGGVSDTRPLPTLVLFQSAGRLLARLSSAPYNSTQQPSSSTLPCKCAPHALIAAAAAAPPPTAALSGGLPGALPLLAHTHRGAACGAVHRLCN